MLLDRLLTNVPGLRARVARDHLRVAPGPVWPRVLAAARLLWEVPRPHRRSHEALILDLQRGQCRDQGLLALADEAVNGPQALVGDLLGVIRAVGPAEPAELADIVAVDTAVGGADGRTALGSAATVVTRPATTRALCEAAERLAAGAAVDTAVVGCAAELGAAATSWLPYTDEQYETPGFAYAPLADEHVTHWSRGRDVATGRALWVPTRLASLDPRCVGPRFAPTTSTGLAAGADVWSAISRGLLEVVERDVVTRCWTTAALDELAAEAWAGAAVQSLRGRSCTVRVWRCRDPAPVVIAWLAQPDGGGALGCAAAMTLGDAARHALEEAALMLVHRRRADALLAPACCPVGAPSVDVTPADVWADLPGLVRRYEPWWVELTDRNAAAVGLHVVAVGSRRAVDFPGPGRPPALRRCALLADNLRDDFPFAPPEMP